MSKLQEKRIAAGLSQSQLAKAAGVAVGVLQHYEQGTRNIDGVKIGTLADLAAALGCKITDILESPELVEKVRRYS